MNYFSAKSLEKLSSCDRDLICVMEKAISISRVDFGISSGFRTIRSQEKLFKEGRSDKDGITNPSKHNSFPAEACDIFISSVPVDLYDLNHLCYIAGVIEAVSDYLYEEKIITHRVRWGGNWDRDKVLLIDQAFDDACHFELVD